MVIKLIGILICVANLIKAAPAYLSVSVSLLDASNVMNTCTGFVVGQATAFQCPSTIKFIYNTKEIISKRSTI